MVRSRSRRVVVLLAAMVAVSFAGPVAGPASADHRTRLVVMFDQARFLAQHPPTATESFDETFDFPVDQKTVTFEGVRFTSLDPFDPGWAVDGILFRRFSTGNESVDAMLRFGNGGSVRSVGFRLNIFATPNRFVVRVVEVDGTVTRIWLRPDSVDAYVGLHSRVGITRVVVTQRPDLIGGGESNFGFDDLARTPIRQ